MEDTLKQLLGARRLRQRGLALALADSAVLAMEIVGEFLSLHQDKAIFTYFRPLAASGLYPAAGSVPCGNRRDPTVPYR